MRDGSDRVSVSRRVPKISRRGKWPRLGFRAQYSGAAGPPKASAGSAGRVELRGFLLSPPPPPRPAPPRALRPAVEAAPGSFPAPAPGQPGPAAPPDLASDQLVRHPDHPLASPAQAGFPRPHASPRMRPEETPLPPCPIPPPPPRTPEPVSPGAGWIGAPGGTVASGAESQPKERRPPGRGRPHLALWACGKNPGYRELGAQVRFWSAPASPTPLHPNRCNSHPSSLKVRGRCRKHRGTQSLGYANLSGMKLPRNWGPPPGIPTPVGWGGNAAWPFPAVRPSPFGSTRRGAGAPPAWGRGARLFSWEAAPLLPTPNAGAPPRAWCGGRGPRDRPRGGR